MQHDQILTIKKPQARRRRSFSKRRKDNVPKPDQWKHWKVMQFCAVEDSRNGERLIFHVGDDVRVLNHDWKPDGQYNLWDSWIGRIQDIRGNSPRNTWVDVQWYFSGEDIANRRPVDGGKDTSCYGKFERSLSQDRQMISTFSINGKATVINYDDTACDQELVPSECFYTRRLYNSLFDTLTPNIVSSITCTCGQPYNPDDTTPMRFCPRFGCKQWYHERCLDNDLMSNKSPDERTQGFLDIPQAQLGRVPPDLLRLACTPIIRGGLMYGVAGNVKVVSQAQEWAQLYADTSESNPVPLMNGITLDRWLDSLEGVEVEELIYPDDDSLFGCKRARHEEVSLYVCPSCGKHI